VDEKNIYPFALKEVFLFVVFKSFPFKSWPKDLSTKPGHFGENRLPHIIITKT
jgi:hypothetical protein